MQTKVATKIKIYARGDQPDKVIFGSCSSMFYQYTVILTSSATGEIGYQRHCH